MKTFHILAIASLLLVNSMLFAQTQTSKPNDVRLPSPNAASLGIFGEIPMNLSAGMASYSIPLYQLQSGSLLWPISLHYAYTGYRPNEEPSWTGRGWTLSAGGIITRMVKGYADEDQFTNLGNIQVEGYIKGIDKVKTIYEVKSFSSVIGDDYQNLLHGRLDGEPDVFNVSCGKLNGKFYYGYITENGVTSKRFQFVTNRKVNISYTLANQQNPGGQGNTPVISSFTITDEDGTKYEFTQKEWSFQKTLLPAIEETTEYDYVVTAWHITRITSQKGDVINFNYKQTDFQDRRAQLHRQEVLYKAAPKTFNLNCYGSQATVEGRSADGKATTFVNFSTEAVLTSIESRQVTATFEAQRFEKVNDLTAYSGELTLKSVYNRLNALKIKNIRGEVVKNWKFQYKWPEEKNADLILKSVQEIDNNLSTSLPPYVFSYDNEDNILLKNGQRLYITTLGVDRWGYYNGYENAKTINDGTLLPSGGAFRGSVPEKARWGALTKVVYPTGGSTAFTYELNDFSKIVEREGSENFQYLVPEEYSLIFRFGQWESDVNISVPFTSSYTYTYRYCQVYTTGTGIPSICNFLNADGRSSKTYSGVFLPNQTYTRAQILPSDVLTTFANEADNNVNTVVEIRIKLLKNMSTSREPGSGIRIKKIETYDTNNQLVNTKEYTYNDPLNSTKSSGQIYRRPTQELTNFLAGIDPTNVSFCSLQLGPPVSISMTSYQNSDQVAPIVSYNNNFVLYDYVEELENGTQLKKHYFNTFKEYRRPFLTCGVCPVGPQLIGNLLADLYTPPILDFAVGLPKKSESFVGDNSSNRRLVHAKSTTYLSLSEITVGIFSPAIAVANLAYYGYPVCNCQYDSTQTATKVTYISPPIISATKYNVYSYFFYSKANSETIVASNSTEAIVTDEVYTYNPDHYMLQSVTKNRSDGTSLKEEYRYPLDYASVNASSRASWLTKMISNSYVSPIIETRTYLTRGGSTSIVNASLMTYKEVGNSVLPANSYTFKSVAPISSMAFYDGLAFNIASYPNYREMMSYDSYDSYGNLVQATPKDGVPVSYLWAYKGNFPVAVVKNAAYTSISSLLPGNFSNLTDSPTIKGAISQVRSLTTALVEASLYSPSVGVSEKIDPAGLSTYYEYDKLNRLAVIRNAQGNKVKKYDYNYRLQFSKGNPIPDQTFIVSYSATYTIPQEAFINPTGQTLTYTLQGLPSGLNYMISGISIVISGTPTVAGSSTVTVKATNSVGEEVQTSFRITVLSAAPPLTILQPLYDCQTGVATFQYSGGDGSPVEYTALLISNWALSTNTFTYNPYPGDGSVTMRARQNSNPTNTINYLWDWKGQCQASNKAPLITQVPASQSLAVGDNFTLSLASIFTDPENQEMTYTATGLPTGLALNGSGNITGTPSATGVYAITLKATDLYSATASTAFSLTVKAGAPQALSLTQPTYNCETKIFAFNTAGGNGSTIEYFAIGVTGWTTQQGGFHVDAYCDAQPFTLYARQSGVTVSYTWDFRPQCCP